MKTNLQTRKLVADLRKAGQKVALWKRVADELERPTRQMPSVNLSKIALHVREGEVALVPGKVLSLGHLVSKTSVAAFQFSELARKKIGKAISIAELLKENPQGKKVRLIK
ncbi:50S ribosomal protein L18e [Candidatus Woesearchaeota archaeon]|nr:50S ribosomal protein L18e [Candidatus Woesearchaeota archaeon]